MPKVKPLTVACFAAFMFLPALTSADIGGLWLIEGRGLTLGQTLRLLPTFLVLNPKESVLRILAVPSIEIKCEGEQINVEEGRLIGPDGLSAKKLTFHLCRAASSEPCTLANESISTVPIHGLASLDLQGVPASLSAYVLLLPGTKTTFATFGFEGENCALLGTQAVAGTASLLIHGALHELLLHIVLVFSLPKALKAGSTEADLEKIDLDIALLEHEKWSFH